MKTNRSRTGRKCDYCPSKDASPLTLKDLTVVSSCESCYEAGAFKAAKPTHTPGPWIQPVTYDPESGRERPCGAIEAVNADGDGEAIIVASCRDLTSEEWMANARLIAAAPDLLAALIECRAWIGGCSRDVAAHADAAILRATEGK